MKSPDFLGFFHACFAFRPPFRPFFKLLAARFLGHRYHLFMSEPEPNLPLSANDSNGLPFFIRTERPQIADGASLAVGGCSYGNTAAEKLLRCIEAVRDLRVQADRLLAIPTEKRSKREVKPFSVPLFTLFDLTLSLLTYLKADPVVRRQLSVEEHERIEKLLRVMEEHGLKKNGDLGLVRSKLAAHVDSVALKNRVVWDKVDVVQFAKWARLLLATLSQTLLFKQVFAWTELGTPEDVWNLMAVDGTIVHLIKEDGDWNSIGGITDAMSPRVAISDELLAARKSIRQLLGDFREEWVAAEPRGDES